MSAGPDPSAVAVGDPADVADDNRYRIHARIEIVALLRAIAAERQLVTVHFGTGGDAIVSAVLAIDTDFDEVVFDHGVDAAAMQRLFRAERIRISTHLDGIRIALAAERAGPTSFEGAPAFRIRLPASILRLQRREAYRVKIPLGSPIVCEMRQDEDKPARIAVRVHDISATGIGLVDYPASMRMTVGMLRHACRLDLPNHGTVTSDLEVRHATETTPRRCGCRFVGIPASAVNLIQRYITKLERDRHATS